MSSRFLRGILKLPKLPSTNIPEYVKDAATGKLSENSPLKYLWQYRKGSIKRRYATFGAESGLKAGICWPSKDELQYLKEYEKNFEKSFETMRKELRRKEKVIADKRKKREIEIRANLAQLPKQKEEFWKNYHELHQNINKEQERKNKVIQEVQEFLGYEIESNDPRFEEALLKKEEEEKNALRAQRKLDKQRQAMEMLQALVSDALEKEKTKDKKTEETTENVASKTKEQKS